MKIGLKVLFLNKNFNTAGPSLLLCSVAQFWQFSRIYRYSVALWFEQVFDHLWEGMCDTDSEEQEKMQAVSCDWKELSRNLSTNAICPKLPQCASREEMCLLWSSHNQVRKVKCRVHKLSSQITVHIIANTHLLGPDIAVAGQVIGMSS